jgi:hypothetical protein
VTHTNVLASPYQYYIRPLTTHPTAAIMSEVPPATSLDLEQLKRDAEAQQRRRAPPLAGQKPKRRKIDDTDAADDGQDEEGPVSRFSYAADREIAAGSTCFMASCGFNRWDWGRRKRLKVSLHELRLLCICSLSLFALHGRGALQLTQACSTWPPPLLHCLLRMCAPVFLTQWLHCRALMPQATQCCQGDAQHPQAVAARCGCSSIVS